MRATDDFSYFILHDLIVAKQYTIGYICVAIIIFLDEPRDRGAPVGSKFACMDWSGKCM